MMRAALIVVTFCVVCLSAVSATSGQTPPVSPEAAEDLRPAELQRLFDAYVVVQVQEALKLSDDQFSQVLPRLRALQQTRRQSTQQRQKLINELQRLTNPRQPQPAPAAVLEERLHTLRELDSRSAAEMRRAYDAVDELLDVPQQARFRVFEEQVERRKLQLLLKARQKPRRVP